MQTYHHDITAEITGVDQSQAQHMGRDQSYLNAYVHLRACHVHEHVPPVHTWACLREMPTMFGFI